MNYIGCHFKWLSGTLDPVIAFEILIAELGEQGFDSFTENRDELIAYIQKDNWQQSLLDQIQILSSEEVQFSVEINEIEQVNWNEEWEKNFEPIEVEGTVSVRAPFHKSEGLDYDIVIEPKMSFGTGHHETTYLMVKHLIGLDLTDKKVLDMGCGTGILAIFAKMKGASSVDAIDIDQWCYENALENVAKNNVQDIQVFQGDVSLLKANQYDLVIANINRNILLQDMPEYVGSLRRPGQLLLSGFYHEDIDHINDLAVKLGLRLNKTLERNNWVGLKYVI